MRYLQQTIEMAESRGYFAFPEVVAMRSRVPGWLTALGTDEGLGEFEAARGIVVPGAIREFYRSPLLACFLEVALDGEVFLKDYAEYDEEPMPGIVEWFGRPHLVHSFHNHSGMVLAAEIGPDDPRVFIGWGEDPEPCIEKDQIPETFSQMIFRVVDRHEDRLDQWQSLYERCRADPAEARRIGGLEWVRDIPGMAARLGPG